MKISSKLSLPKHRKKLSFVENHDSRPVFFISKKKNKLKRKSVREKSGSMLSNNSKNSFGLSIKESRRKHRKSQFQGNLMTFGQISREQSRLPSLEVESRVSSKIRSMDKQNLKYNSFTNQLFPLESNITVSGLKRSCLPATHQTKLISDSNHRQMTEKEKSKDTQMNPFNSSLWRRQTKTTEKRWALKEKKRNVKFRKNSLPKRNLLNLPQIQKENLVKKSSFQEKSINNERKTIESQGRALFNQVFKEIDSIYLKFKKLTEIGSGSYAVAYLAQHKRTGEKLVLKTFKLADFVKNSHINRFMVNIQYFN